MEEQTKVKRINSKSKGAGFESTIAKRFTEVFSPLVFKRVPQSGAYAGGMNSRFNHHYSNSTLSAFVGDIFVSNEDDVAKTEAWKFKFTVECKFYKEADNFSALFKNTSLISWWEQASSDAAKVANKAPILIFKYNHTPVYAGIDPTLTPLPPKMLQTVTLRYYVKDVERRIEICLLDELLKEVDWWKTPSF